MDETDRLRRRITGLEKTLQIVTGYSGRTEKNLRQLFEVISDTMPVPMLIFLETGGILFSNGKAQEIFGYSEEDFRKKNTPDLYGNVTDYREFLKISHAECEVKNFAVTLKKADGSIFPASLFSHRTVFEGQNCLLTVIYDLSELSREEEKRMSLEIQIRQTRKMEAIGTMAGGIAHEFNNILAIIFGQLQMAIRKLPQKSKSRENVDNALTAATRASVIVRQILDFCHHKEQEQKQFRISTVIRDATKMLTSLTPSKIRVNLRVESESPIIQGDPTQIHQVLMNLCINANYVLLENGGTVEIVLEELHLSRENQTVIPGLKPGFYVRLTVSDNGPGIDKKIIDSVFDPFFTSKSQGEGTGMGLAVVHGIVQSHGGDVAVESEFGKGAAFHCYFPIVAQAGGIAGAGITPKEMKGSGETVLFVDAEQDTLAPYGEMLENLGYEVVTCYDGGEALNVFQKYPGRFDLLIADIDIQAVVGKTTALEILEICPDIPVIIVTCGKSENKIPSDIPARQIIRKPFSQNRIGTLIREVLDKKQEIGDD